MLRLQKMVERLIWKITRTSSDITAALDVTYITSITGFGTDHAIADSDFIAPDGGTGTVNICGNFSNCDNFYSY